VLVEILLVETGYELVVVVVVVGRDDGGTHAVEAADSANRQRQLMTAFAEVDFGA
jgi:hypothetical protein